MKTSDEINIALQALAKGTPVAMVAEATGKTPRTIQRWKADNLKLFEELRDYHDKRQLHLLLGLDEGSPDWEERHAQIQKANDKHLIQVRQAKSLALAFFKNHVDSLEQAQTPEQISEVLNSIPTRQLMAYAKLLESMLIMERRISYLDIDLNRIVAIAKKRGYVLIDPEDSGSN